MNNLEKAKSLKAVRKRLRLTQNQMANALGLDPSYLSQLENSRRPIDDFYLERADQIEREIEKAKIVKAQPAIFELDLKGEIRRKVHAYIDRVLDSCNGESDQLAWTYVEIKRHFPVDSANREQGSSSNELSGEAVKYVVAGEKALAIERQLHSHSPKADATNAQKPETSRGASQVAKGKQSPLKQVPELPVE